MKVRVVLAVFACMMFVFGVNQLKECAGQGGGAKVQTFRNNVAEYKEIMSRNRTIQSKDLQDARDKIENAGSPEEKKAAYEEQTEALGEMFINDQRAMKKLDKAIELITKDGSTFFADGKEAKEEFGDEMKEVAVELGVIFAEIETDLSVISLETEEGATEAPGIAETRDLFEGIFKSNREAQAKLLKSIETIMGTGIDDSSADSAIGDIKSTLEYAKFVLDFARLSHLAAFKMSAAVGKVKKVVGRMRDLMKEVFAGLDPDEFLDGIHNDSYDTSYIAFLMQCDLEDMAAESGVISEEMVAKIKTKVRNLRTAPPPGSVNDGNPDHHYFYNKKKDRWFYITKKDRKTKHWAPFDKEANTGKYVRYDISEGQWYSTAPVYKGKENKIISTPKKEPAKM